MSLADRPLVASLVWRLPSEMHELQAEAVQRLGYPHRFFHAEEPIPPGAGIVLVQGPFGTLLPLARQLAARPISDRPVLAYWFEESLDMRWPARLRGRLASAFSELNQRHPATGPVDRLLSRVTPEPLARRGHRLRFLGDIRWLHARGLLDVLAVSSTVYAAYLERQFGISSLLVPRGYHPGYGRLLDLQRDIAVVWMGQTRTRRRELAIYWLRDQLAQRGQTMQIHDGKSGDFIFGEKRTQILNRARFILNVFTQAADELSIRYFVAAANGAVVLTEPGANKYPFASGKHWVQRPIEEMPDTVMHFLEHEKERRSIAREMLDLMQSELTLERSIAAILARAETLAESRRPGRLTLC